MKYITFLILLLVSLIISGLRGIAAIPVSSEILRLNNTKGLSSQEVYSFVEDNKGAIWIGFSAVTW